MNHKPLFIFCNESLELCEIKRLDLAQDSAPDALYHWLLYNKDSQKLEKLAFVSMHSDANTQYREFEQAKLVFDDKSAALTIDEQTNNLKLSTELSAKCQQGINSYLDNLP